MNAKELAKEMKARKVASGWEARCPAHDDQQASLSISEGSDGRVLLHCHAGCSFGDVAAALRLQPAELFPPKESGNGKHTAPVTPTITATTPKKYKTISDAIRDLSRKHGEHTGRWDYCDAGGYVVGVVLRFDKDSKKTIRPIAETAEGWVLGGMPEPRPLYNLPDLYENPDATVYVCEGEKACEAGRRMGLLTTTSPHGANSASKADWSVLTGRDVVILPDNDDPGKKYAATVRDILAGIADSVRIVELPGLPPGGDLVEWEEMGKGKVEIEGLTPAQDSCPIPEWEWQESCNWIYSETGRRIKADAYNLGLVLANDLRDSLAWNDFVEDVVCISAPPWHDPEFAHMGQSTLQQPWTDPDYTRLRLWLQRAWKLSWKKTDIYDVVPVVAQRQRFHPVRSYLDSLQWDGKSRIDTWLSSYLAAPDTEYTKQVGPKWLIAAVARVFSPGCKADNVLILEGKQGAGKSSALKILAGDWFSDTPFHISGTDAYLALRGSWIVELAELDSLMRAEDSAAKAFFSSAIDKYRPPYARAVVEYPRQCVFAGSVNHADYLRDATGGRRYWPVLCGRIDIDALIRDRDQLWAEAVRRYKSGRRWWLDGGQQALAAEEQEQRSTDDPWEEPILDWLKDHLGGGGLLQITVNQILSQAINMDTEKMGRPHETRVGKIMTQIGWVRQRKRVDGIPRTVYIRPEQKLE